MNRSMDLLCRVFLLHALALFSLGGAEYLQKYKKFEGLAESVAEDVHKELVKNRVQSAVRHELKRKQFDDYGIDAKDRDSLTKLFLEYKAGKLPFKSPPSIWDFLADFALKYYKPRWSSTASPYTEKTVTPTSESISSAIPSSSTAGYSTVTPVTKKQSTKSTPEPASSSEAPSVKFPGTCPPSECGGVYCDPRECYRTVTPETEKQTSTSKPASSSSPPPSSTAGYNTATPATKKQARKTTPKPASSSAAPSSSSAGYSTVTPVIKKQPTKSTPKPASSSEAPTSSASGYSTTALTQETATSTPSKSSGSSTEAGPFIPSSKHPYRVGSIRGNPGEHFPDYTDIPITDFSCYDKPAVPGFYADLDAGCQVFHVCWPDRRETFLCPVGTTFNQAILACDYWYSNNCSMAPLYYSVNMDTRFDPLSELIRSDVVGTSDKELDVSSAISILSHFLPVKAKVAVYPEIMALGSEAVPNIVSDRKATATYGDKPVPKSSVSSIHRSTSAEFETTSQSSSEVTFKDKVEEAVQQAYDEITNHFAPLLQQEPLDKNMLRLKEFYESHLLDVLMRLRSGQYIPSSLVNKPLSEVSKETIDKIENWRNYFVNLIINTGGKLVEVQLSRLRPNSRLYSIKTPSTELDAAYDPRPAELAVPAEVYSTGGRRLATVKPLTKLNPRFITKPLPMEPAVLKRKRTKAAWKN